MNNITYYYAEKVTIVSFLVKKTNKRPFFIQTEVFSIACFVNALGTCFCF
ncbi:hypothetical protein M23134_02733 [Microscilla marina ATCC 23134]|uniref:Uncharacterized protein n=1 Tax=Microscilla marina ATCC 23134 TaxID=313606 RepID=A1ZZ45_MICM2|nr:hypothetical protein M23134_02733 [Microscilla marina ATCC 23134]